MNDKRLTNARKKMQESFDKMTPEGKHRAGQLMRQGLAEHKEREYQNKRKAIAMIIWILVILCAIAFIALAIYRSYQFAG